MFRLTIVMRESSVGRSDSRQRKQSLGKGKIMYRKFIVIVALMSIITLSGCNSNKTDYNNNTSLLWGLFNRTTSGGEGTDDAPALSDRKPNTHIDQKGGSGSGNKRRKSRHKDRPLN